MQFLSGVQAALPVSFHGSQSFQDLTLTTITSLHKFQIKKEGCGGKRTLLSHQKKSHLEAMLQYTFYASVPLFVVGILFFDNVCVSAVGRLAELPLGQIAVIYRIIKLLHITL